MSIKIDLLPGYLRLQRIFKRVLQLSLLLLGATGALLFVINSRQQEKLRVVTENATNYTARAAEVKKVSDQATAITNGLGATRSASAFFVDASKTGAQRAALLDQVRRYIYGRTLVQSLDLSSADGVTVKMTVNIQTPDDYAEFLRQIRFAELDGFFAPGSAKGSGIPVYNNGVPTESTLANTPGGAPGPPQGAPGGVAQPVSAGPEGPEEIRFPITANIEARLVNPITLPVPPGAAAPAAAGGPPGGPPPGAGGPGGP